MNLFKELVLSAAISRAEQDWNNSGLARIYLIRMTRTLRGKRYESFLKLGYSHCFDLADRFKWFPATFTVEVIDTIILPKDEAYKNEMMLHRALRCYKHCPRSKFNGKGEAYSESLLKNHHTIETMINLVLHPEPEANILQSLN